MTSNLIDYPKIEDIPVSTKTFIVMTNLTLDIKKLYEFLPLTPFVLQPKKRGKKKKTSIMENGKTIENGSIITMKFENKIKGVDLKQKKSHNKKKKSKWFRNSFTIVMVLDGKPINFKVCQNGVLQVTGCKKDDHAEGCIKHLWEKIKDEEGNFFTYNRGDSLDVIFIPAMRNIDFNLGFLVDREKLARFMSTETEFHSLLETSFGYTGVSIKYPLNYDITQLQLKRLNYIEGDFVETEISYGEYLERLSEKERNKKLKKDRFISFLTFQSGRCICSGLTEDLMREAYNNFVKVIRVSRDKIEEKLDL